MGGKHGKLKKPKALKSGEKGGAGFPDDGTFPALQIKMQTPADPQIVKLMVTMQDLPRQLILQQKIMEEYDGIDCFHCKGTGRIEKTKVDVPKTHSDGMDAAGSELKGVASLKKTERLRVQIFMDNDWKAVAPEEQVQMSEHMAQGKLQFEIAARGQTYKIDLSFDGPGKQTNVKSGKERKLRLVDPDDDGCDGPGGSGKSAGGYSPPRPLSYPPPLSPGGKTEASKRKKKLNRAMVAWLYQERRGSWAVFDSDMAQKLNEAYKEGVGALLQVTGPSFEYVIDMGEMTQTNAKTKTQRKVLRISDEGNPQLGSEERFAWQFVVDPGQFGADDDGWIDASERNTAALEAAWRAHQAGSLEDPILPLRGPNGDVYNFDVASMMQRNIKRDKTGQVRRVSLKPVVFDSLACMHGGLGDVTESSDEDSDEDPGVQPDLQKLGRIPTGSVLPPGVCWVCRGSGQTSKWLEPFDDASKLNGVAAEDLEWPDCPICYCEAAYGISRTCEHYYCDTCIDGSLNGIIESGQFPAICPMCRAEAGGKDPGKGHIEEGALTFLQQRTIITKAFQFRFLKQQNKTLQIEEPDFFECPAKCGEFILASDPSYDASRIGDLYTDKTSGDLTVQLGACPSCNAKICIKCQKQVLPDAAGSFLHKCEDLSQKLAQDDKASLEVMAKIGKKCPGCGGFIQKTDGCHIMMCGTTAHGKVADALRNGGCACIFDWNTLKPCDDGHGYTALDGKWVRGAGPKTDRQVLLK